MSMSKKAKIIKIVVVSSLIATSTLVFGQVGPITKADIDKCNEGLDLLFIDGASGTDLKYKHPAEPKTTWDATYAQFKKNNYPACDKIIKNYAQVVNQLTDPNSSVSKAREAINAACKANPVDYKVMNDNIQESMKSAIPAVFNANLNDLFYGKEGIVSMGDRIGPYCPKLHKIQFDCVFARERITNSTKTVKTVFEELKKYIQ